MSVLADMSVLGPVRLAMLAGSLVAMVVRSADARGAMEERRQVYASLDRLDRRLVARAVRKGEPVQDPRLAEAGIAHARSVYAGSPTARNASTVLAVLYFVTGVASSAFAGDALGVAINGGLLAVVGIGAVTLGPLATGRARRSEEATRRAHGLG